jgi:YMGG-like Gly-zipper
MQRIRQSVVITIVLTLLGMATVAEAQWSRWARRDDRQASQILARIEQRTVRFKNSAQQAMNQSSMSNTQKEDRLDRLVSEFQQSVMDLRSRYNRNQATNTDVQGVLDRAQRIDRFMQRHQLRSTVASDWQLLRTDLDSLASSYNIAWDWNREDTRDGAYLPDRVVTARLSGTFRLNTTQSDNARLIVERAVRDLPYSDRQRVSEALLRRVEAPDVLAIDRQGRMIMLASSKVPQLTFEADGQEHVETFPNSNRTSRVTASLTGDTLTINSTGDRASDFSVTFDPINNGRQMRVTRRLYNERLNQPIVVQSVYDQESPTARWDIYNGPAVGDNRYGPDRGGNYNSTNDYVVPDNMLIVGRLNEMLDTTQVRSGDRFTMTVVSPPEYRDAIIEGHIGDVNRSGRLTGRAELALAFDTIRLRDGRSARFDGTLDSVRATNGDTLRVDTEGTVREDSSQTNRTVTRAAIGSAVGALIGAIAGGGKGAAIGAVVGGGAGAGSVFVQGRNDLQLTPGTEITIRASAPMRRAMR